MLGTLYGASTTTMAAATLLRATPLFSGEGAGRAMAARVHVGVVGSCRAQTRAVTPGICPGRSRRRPGTTIAGSFAAAITKKNKKKIIRKIKRIRRNGRQFLGEVL